jgi:putative Holliday junction resolvase
LRIMALDVGDKRIGVAVSDPFGWTSAKMLTVDVNEDEDVVERLKRLIAEEGVGKIITGLPRNMDGTDSEQTKKVRRFAETLESVVDVPIQLWDERLSTVAATKSLLQAGLKRRQRKRVVDGVAASLILQSYLDSRQSGQE